MMFKNLQIKLESFNEIQQDFRVSRGTRSDLVPSPFQVLVYARTLGTTIHLLLLHFSYLSSFQLRF